MRKQLFAIFMLLVITFTAACGNKPKDKASKKQKDITIVSHQVDITFPEDEGVTATCTYPEFVLSDEMTLAYPKLWAALVNYNDMQETTVLDDTKAFGYSEPDSSKSYTYNAEGQVVRLDDSVCTIIVKLSFSWDNSEGSAAPYYEITNFDVKTGNRLESDAIIAKKDGFDNIVYGELLKQYPDHEMLFTRLTDEGEKYALDNIRGCIEYGFLSCYITGGDFMVHFGAFALTPDEEDYDVKIPVADIKNYLNPDYLEDKSGDMTKRVAEEKAKVLTAEGRFVNSDGIWGDEDMGPQEEVKVSTAEDFINAVSSNKEIVLAPGTYDITGYEKFDSITNLTIRSEDPVNKAHIVVKDPVDDVLSFTSCSYITLSDLIVGHDTKPGTCMADVVKLVNSYKISLSGMDLYGCGAYGISAYGTPAISTTDSVIHDCTNGAVFLSDYCNGVYFNNCSINNNKEFFIIDVSYNSGGTVEFENCDFQDNKGDFYSNNGQTGITFTDCTFGEAERKYLDENFDIVTYVENGAVG